MDQDQLITAMTEFLDLFADGIEILSRIERHLGTLAEYAEMMRIQATGEKMYEVGSYVVSTTSQGDKCVYLYATHPGLQYRVCTVYEERLHELPFTIPATAKIWDGEAAPSREGAAKKGYILATPAAFRVSLLPTGGTTDAGLPIHKFSRVLPDAASEPVSKAAEPEAKPTVAVKAAPEPVKAPEFDAEFDNLPSHANSAYKPAAVPAAKPASGLPDLPFKDQGAAVRFAAQFAHYQKPDGSPDFPHIVGSLDKLCAGLGVKAMKDMDKWSRPWAEHVLANAA